MTSPQWNIVKSFLQHPFSTGAVAPCSSKLCRAMISEDQLKKAATVIELGPGSGTITRHIARALPPDATFLSIEKDPYLYSELVIANPDVQFINDDAANLPCILRQRGLSRADLIISSLPWASFSQSQQGRVMQAIRSSLSASGSFTTYTYLPSSILPSYSSFKQRLNWTFQNISTSDVIWSNFPPAYVYQCR